MQILEKESKGSLPSNAWKKRISLEKIEGAHYCDRCCWLLLKCFTAHAVSGPWEFGPQILHRACCSIVFVVVVVVVVVVASTVVSVAVF